ncbi:hypothetical protein [Corynebacterium sp.]|uniref:hypothetical protein n=1 Tax=Corynebacterium sp. TaxID=1720 RepID=UPI0026DD1808|nr:hypothetical protein [Corynebacterium sp.]MDO5075797.1 hypothetical protein [Corynebacterium sp.]
MAWYVVSLVAGCVGVLLGAGIAVWASVKVCREHQLGGARARQHRAVRVLADFLAQERQRIDTADVAPTNGDYRYIGAAGMHLAYIATLEAIDADVIDSLGKVQTNLAELRTYAFTEPLLDATIVLLHGVVEETAHRAAGRKPARYLGALVT